ncbi:methylenetetrahydrofolate reductase [Paenibacillus sambharensis]|uniref:Methylenetetrahydrofolate reductase n=1 Tax=Paenibacillus sambharensis TaxID=1803190 RepID=A0A2W1LJB7_9BACL|nr:methylenetetrahydrofolate reductase [Paenibacillus sambharensis]PZD95102.1 methylenetetrahydrofolate reductase [Paenibacillus sambharensis]
MRISIELIPRDLTRLQQELDMITASYRQINMVNIPDLMRLQVRSWEGAKQAVDCLPEAVPHIRAIDFDLRQPFVLGEELMRGGIREVLIVAGDPPADMKRKVFPTTSTELIRKLRQEYPELKVYAAIDPYRAGLREELEYAQRKLEAGAAGFFTQPFFDLRHMELFAEQLEGIELYWGVSPVMTDGSQGYWETKNRAVFPRDFRPTMEWNVAFARRALQFAKDSGNYFYFMPIKVDLKTYLDGVFAE